MGLFDKFKIGLGKSSDGLSTGFKNIFSKKKIDENVLTEFEELIITSDAGVEVAKELRKDLENFKVDKKINGGLIVKVGTKMIDTSLANKINRLKIAMKGV